MQKALSQGSAKAAKAKGRGQTAPAVASALRTLTLENEGLTQLGEELKGRMAVPFSNAVSLLAAVKGRVIVTGIGKSGHVGQKIAATFASTGTPAFFVHPSEASHGDLGMVTPDDLILALSWSGETVELKPIITYSRRFNVPLVSHHLARRIPRSASSPTSCCSCRAPRKPARTGWRRPRRPPCSWRSATALPSRCSRPRGLPRTTSRSSTPAARSGASLKYVAT